MPWPTGAFLNQHLRLPDDMQLCQLSRADVPPVIAAIGTWHPDFAIGGKHALLTSTLLSPRTTAVARFILGEPQEERQ